jgi:uncharacterized protein
MPFVFVDTSAWLAGINRKDGRQKTVDTALRAPGVRLLTSSDVFDETITLARKRHGHEVAVAVGEFLRSDEVELMPVDEEDRAAAWELFKSRPDKAYSLTDCTSFVLMRRLGIQDAIALDDDFRQEGFRVKP